MTKEVKKKSKKKVTSYKDAGVDVKKGDAFVEKIKKMVKSTYNDRVYEGVGGFASLYDITPDKLLATGTDGVGTKLMLANMLNIHNTIGIDLVAMCVNDIICTGARPLFFLDYLATGKLDIEISQQIIEGITNGCLQAHMALIGGETAEMPGMYSDNEYDLAGFAVGEVLKSELINGETIMKGDSIIGVSSSGIHSNGYSLVRKLIKKSEKDLLKQCLTPTKIYVELITRLKNMYPKSIKGLAHITGGGIANIQRIRPEMHFNIESMPSLDEIPEIFSILKERSGLPDDELNNTFNMGVGFVIITDRPDDVCSTLDEFKEKHWILGTVS